MGTPDTLVLDPPVVCPVCGKTHNETQTHLLGDMLSTWRIGDIVRYSPVSTGILNESVHCCRIEGTDQWTSIPLFVVIWHGIYAGHALSEEAAMAKQNSIDRLDLMRWLDQAQQEIRDWRSRYRHLRSDISEWRDEQKNPRAERPERERFFGIFNALPDEILNDPEPLSRILERNSEDQPAPRGLFED